MKTYCVGHNPPLFTASVPFVLLTPVGLPIECRQRVVPDDSGGPRWDGRVLSEYKQLFSLLNDSSEVSNEGFVHIFQYRKFLSLRPSGQRAENMNYVHVADSKLASTLFPDTSELSLLENKLVHGPILEVRSLAAQYGTCHLIEDFCAFSASCLHSGVFTPQALKSFINCQYLIPAPSLGIFPVHWLNQTMKRMVTVWSDFSEHYLSPRDGYQRRVGGFLLERLHSFLLVELIKQTRQNDRVMASQIVVSESKQIKVTI